jgi:catechol 2,3-dioxygenase-like lactoylglutathione lyase family enzyme
MSVQLNHTIIHTRDKNEAAEFYSDILGLPAPSVSDPFLTVACANDVTLAFADYLPSAMPQHYAFLVSESEFDAIFERLSARGLRYWADPMHTSPSEINNADGGRGLYWEDPNGHNLEIITRPYGSGA